MFWPLINRPLYAPQAGGFVDQKGKSSFSRSASLV
jgi:hypothetical protein